MGVLVRLVIDLRSFSLMNAENTFIDLNILLCSPRKQQEIGEVSQNADLNVNDRKRVVIIYSKGNYCKPKHPRIQQ